MADKEGMERKVYLLPTELVERIQAYQQSQNISSEVEAARRLLDSALQMRDTVFTLLAKIDARLSEEKDLRILARDILIAHPLVTNVHFDDEIMTFTMRGGWGGQANANTSGGLHYQTPDDNGDYWRSYDSYLANQPSPQKKPAKAWDAKSAVDLDDEIPF